MEDIVKMIMNYGTSFVIIGLFIFDWFKNKDKIKDTLEQNTKFLEEMKNTNSNTSKSLELLQKSMDNQQEFMVEHDKRCGNIEKSISELNFKMGVK
ncbi:MAG: hypothetical protein RR290_00750 [Clostridia bacterium]